MLVLATAVPEPSICSQPASVDATLICCVEGANVVLGCDAPSPGMLMLLSRSQRLAGCLLKN